MASQKPSISNNAKNEIFTILYYLNEKTHMEYFTAKYRLVFLAKLYSVLSDFDAINKAVKEREVFRQQKSDTYLDLAEINKTGLFNSNGEIVGGSELESSGTLKIWHNTHLANKDNAYRFDQSRIHGRLSSEENDRDVLTLNTIKQLVLASALFTAYADVKDIFLGVMTNVMLGEKGEEQYKFTHVRSDGSAELSGEEISKIAENAVCLSNAIEENLRGSLNLYQIGLGLEITLGTDLNVTLNDDVRKSILDELVKAVEVFRTTQIPQFLDKPPRVESRESILLQPAKSAIVEQPRQSRAEQSVSSKRNRTRRAAAIAATTLSGLLGVASLTALFLGQIHIAIVLTTATKAVLGTTSAAGTTGAVAGTCKLLAEKRKSEIQMRSRSNNQNRELQPLHRSDASNDNWELPTKGTTDVISDIHCAFSQETIDNIVRSFIAQQGRYNQVPFRNVMSEPSLRSLEIGNIPDPNFGGDSSQENENESLIPDIS